MCEQRRKVKDFWNIGLKIQSSNIGFLLFQEGISKFLILTCLLCITSCHDKEALKQALIEKTVEEKVANHQKKKIQTCSKEAMNEAILLADSQMIKLALSQSDSSDRISKPLKPARPEVALPVDTTPIKPLFEDTLLNKKDTNLQLQKPKIIAKDSLSNKKKKNRVAI